MPLAHNAHDLLVLWYSTEIEHFGHELLLVKLMRYHDPLTNINRQRVCSGHGYRARSLMRRCFDFDVYCLPDLNY